MKVFLIKIRTPGKCLSFEALATDLQDAIAQAMPHIKNLEGYAQYTLVVKGL